MDRHWAFLIRIMTFLKQFSGGRIFGPALLVAFLLPSKVVAEPNQTSRRLGDVETQFKRLRSHPEFLTFNHDRDVAARADASPTDTHYQGLARSEAKGRPYLFVTRSGTDDSDRGNLMIIRMGSRDSDGERLRSNRLQSGRSTDRTAPPDLDRVVANIKFSKYHHPGGIQLCGDILAVPLEERVDTDVPEGRVMFYNVEDPENPVALPVTVDRVSEKIGVIALATLPDGKFMLVTTGGDGSVLRFYKSNHDSFLTPGFRFTLYDTFHGSDVEDGIWPSVVAFQGLQLHVQQNENGFRLFLIGGLNTSPLSPFVPGEDLMTLYEVFGWQSGEIRLKQKEQRTFNVTTDLLPTELARSGASKTLQNASFLAGVATYISPTGELLVYGIEHYNWGPDGSVRFVEFRHEQVYREGNLIYERQPVISGPDVVLEDSIIELDASGSEFMGSLRPWVELFDKDNYDGRSVIVDWKDRGDDDFDDFRKLDGIIDGFNDRASSVRWFAPMGWTIRLYDADNHGNDEPTLDLGGVGSQLGIRNLSDPPYKFDNGDAINIDETRVTSVKFIPPDADFYEWDRPLEQMTFQWHLKDRSGNDVPESVARLVPVPRTPWKMRLETFSKGPDVLQVHMFLGPPPFGKVVKELRFIETNRAPRIESAIATASAGGLVNLQVVVQDPDLSDAMTVQIRWGDGTNGTISGNPRGRGFGASHVYLNPSPATLLIRPYVIHVEATDSEGASSARVETPVEVVWRLNWPPSARPDSLSRTPRSSIKVRLETLLANDSDPDGDRIQFDGIVRVFPDGATVQSLADWFHYSPPPGNPGATGGFEYRIRDPFGAESIGVVSIEVAAAPGPSLNLVTITPLEPRGARAEFQGIPGRSYVVFASEFPSGPWQPIGRSVATGNGRFTILDPEAGGTRFYRSEYSPF